MGKPTAEELHRALEEAIRLREKEEDYFYIGKSLLNLNYRMKFLQDVMQKAKHYLHAGEDAHGHAELLRAIEKAEKAEHPNADDEGVYPW